MYIWGKILGLFGGFIFGNLPGALLGLFIGHLFDQGLARNMRGFNSTDEQTQFFDTTFAVLGYIAKSKGVVTKEEIQTANLQMDRMGLVGAARERAQDAFRRGKSPDYALEQELMKLSRLVRGRRDLLMVFLEVQMSGVVADGKIDPIERQVIDRIAKVLGFSPLMIEQLFTRWEAESRFQQDRQNSSGYQQSGSTGYSHYSLDDAYQLLGVSSSATDQDVKRGYRRQMSQHHPDKLVSKGLPPEMLEVAKRKAQQIQEAYEMIKQQRGMR